MTVNVRKEQVVLIGTLALLGVLGYSSFTGAKPRTAAPRGQKPERVEQLVPDVSLALPAPRDLGRAPRDLFSAPRDTHPLPPLDIEAPPLAPLSGLFPPPLPGPAPQHYGKLLRASATPLAVAGLFVTDVDSAAQLAEDQAPLEAAPGGLAIDDALTGEQRAAQLEGLKKLYDWFRRDDGAPRFGNIRNPDKFGLRQRPDEALLFLEINTATGLELFPGQAPIPYERASITEFHFADTVANRILERRREIGDKLTSGQYPGVMDFAAQCLAHRGEAREALPVAIEMYRLANTVADGDPAPRLGLARCHELAFDFEAAFAELESLLAEHAHRPEVHVRLGELEARLRLFDSAEQRFKEALRLARQSFDAQAAYGRFLLARGREAQALEHLELAHRFEPPAEFREQRLNLRLDLAAARLANGKLVGNEAANVMYDSVLSIDPAESRALAGKLALGIVGRMQLDPSAMALPRDTAGFELLLAQGLGKLQAKPGAEARDDLLAAAEADPLRAFAAWRALSWLAEVTGYPAEALRYCDLALEAAPDDAWSLFQHGRLLAQRDDPEGAVRDFKAALDLELGFTDAIAGLGEIAVARGNAADAEMYFGRALELDPARAELEARRGYNYLSLNDTTRAEACFKRAQAIDANEPGARAGLAWCSYRRDDPDRAIELFRALDDARRALPQTEAWRVFALAQIARIEDHIAKEVWEDDFERQKLANGWSVEEAAGPLFTLSEGKLGLHGNLNNTGLAARVWQEYASNQFVSIEMDVSVDSRTSARVGVFLSREKTQQGSTQVTSQISVERHPEGGLQVLLMDRATATPEPNDIAAVGGVPWWPADQVVRLRIERLGEGSDSMGRISVDGIPVADAFPMRAIASTGNVRFGLFAKGNSGQPVHLTIDNVQVVRRIGR